MSKVKISSTLASAPAPEPTPALAPGPTIEVIVNIDNSQKTANTSAETYPSPPPYAEKVVPANANWRESTKKQKIFPQVPSKSDPEQEIILVQTVKKV